MPTVISTAIVSVTIGAAGCEREIEADVRFVYTPFIRGYHEKGGGQIDPDEPENAEILTVKVTGGTANSDGKRDEFCILHLLTDEQVSAIADEILEQRR